MPATTWSPRRVSTAYPRKKLKDPKDAWGKGGDIHITAKNGFAKDFPELNCRLEDFDLSEKAPGSLEAEIDKRGEAYEKESTRKWMNAHPGIAHKLAPVGS